MYKKLGFENDLKSKARILETLFLIAVLVIFFGPGQLDAYLLGTAVAFSIFGFLLYIETVNGQLPEDISETLPVGFTFAGIIVLALRPTYAVEQLSIAALYLLSLGYLVSIGLLSQGNFWYRFQKYRPDDLKRFAKHLMELNQEELKKRFNRERRNLFYAFTSTFLLISATVLLWVQTSGQGLQVSHVIQILVGTFVAAPFVDRWIIGRR